MLSVQPGEQTVAAATGGSLRAAYAQFVIDPDTHEITFKFVAQDGTVIDRMTIRHPVKLADILPFFK